MVGGNTVKYCGLQDGGVGEVDTVSRVLGPAQVLAEEGAGVKHRLQLGRPLLHQRRSRLLDWLELLLLLLEGGEGFLSWLEDFLLRLEDFLPRLEGLEVLLLGLEGLERLLSRLGRLKGLLDGGEGWESVLALEVLAGLEVPGWQEDKGPGCGLPGGWLAQSGGGEGRGGGLDEACRREGGRLGGLGSSSGHRWHR